MQLEFSQQGFQKKNQISISWKSVPVGAELVHVDGQTDRYTEMTNTTDSYEILRKRLKTQSGVSDDWVANLSS
jgi:hypothetical protein